MNVVIDFNIDVHIVFGQKIDIIRYHPMIVQFNAMNQKRVPRISTLINRISVYIRYCFGLELAWILFFAFAFFHAWGIWKCNSIMHLETIHVSWANLFIFGFGSLTMIMFTSLTVCGLKSLAKKMRMCACDNPRF